MFSMTQEDFKALCVMMGMQEITNAQMQNELLKAKLEAAAADFEMSQMRLAADELHESYAILQDYSSGVLEQNEFLRHHIESKSNNGEALPSIDALKVSTLITALTTGNKLAIADAVHKLLPDIGLQDCINLAVKAVSDASGILAVDMDETDVSGIIIVEEVVDEESIPDTEEAPIVVPTISIGDTYPIDGVNVG